MRTHVPLRSGCCHWPCMIVWWYQTEGHVLAGVVHRLASPARKSIQDFIASQNHCYNSTYGHLYWKTHCFCNLSSCVYQYFFTFFAISQMHLFKALLCTLIARIVSLKQPWVKCHAQGQSNKRADLWSQYVSSIWVTLTWAWTCRVWCAIPWNKHGMAFANNFTCLGWHISNRKKTENVGWDLFRLAINCLLMIAGGGEGLKNVKIFSPRIYMCTAYGSF